MWFRRFGLLAALVVMLMNGSGRFVALAGATAAANVTSDGIGSTRAAWEQSYGAGVPAGDLVEYQIPSGEGFTALVGFDGDLVAHIEFGFEETQTGGITVEDAESRVAAALPEDTRPFSVFGFPARGHGETALRAALHQSDSLGALTSGRDTILVLFQEQEKIITPGSAMETIVPRVTLTIPTADEDAPISTATGAPGGIGLSQETWEATYGPGEGTERGFIYPNITFPTPGLSLIVRYNFPDGWLSYLEADYQTGSQLGGASVDDARTQVSNALPVDAFLNTAYDLPATPEGPVALRIEHWQSPSLATQTGDGDIFAVYEVVTTQQNPGSPAQEVVHRLTLTISATE